MRTFTIIMLIALAFLQYKLWFGDGSFKERREIVAKLNSQLEVNDKLAERNRILEADVAELKAGDQALEEQARLDFGMVKEGEVYYQFVD